MLVREIGAALLLAAIVVTGCRQGAEDQPQAGDSASGGDRADVAPAVSREDPAVLNRELPFRYPTALYAQKVQGNVVLRLFVDRDGRARADSTRVEVSSGHTSLDSAAVSGSRELQFNPAKIQGEPVGVAVLFPVYFRHPEGPPLPGDSVLARRP